MRVPTAVPPLPARTPERPAAAAARRPLLQAQQAYGNRWLQRVAGQGLIQRKAIVGDRQAVLQDEFGAPQTANVEVLPDDFSHLGSGDRMILTMVNDQKTRYFANVGELYAYARRKTDDIGYVDREKTWVRLPDRFLVLGERHTGTTLMDLVEATETTRYVYEAGRARPPAILHPKRDVPREPHELEPQLPKLAIGLTAVERLLAERLQGMSRRPGWRTRIRALRRTVERPDLEAAKVKYEGALAVWSQEWEAAHPTPESRGIRGYGKTVGARQYITEEQRNLLSEKEAPPDRPYDRDYVEVRLARNALVEVRDAAQDLDDDHPIARFYRAHQETVDKTITQLGAGLPPHLTRMFLKMATGDFDLGHLVQLLTAASEREFEAEGVPEITKYEDYGTTYERGEQGKRMEELRDSYILHRILEAERAGYRLAGVGDAHRQNLLRVLKQVRPEILVQPWTKFYDEQYRTHPDDPTKRQ